MQKVRIQLEENIRYDGMVHVEQPENMSDSEFEDILGKVERRLRMSFGGIEDFSYELEEMGLKVISESIGFPDSPQSSELEIIDVTDIK